MTSALRGLKLGHKLGAANSPAQPVQQRHWTQKNLSTIKTMDSETVSK